MRGLLADVEDLRGKATNEQVRYALKDLLDEIRYSDPVSRPELAEDEWTIKAKIGQIAQTADDDQAIVLINETKSAIAARNSKCKANK
jgi:hypothetical protein